MANLITWTDDRPSICAEIAARLSAGAVVALPTEAGYEGAASALRPEAVAELVKRAGAEELPALVVGQSAEVFDWLPYLRGAGLRALRVGWPGPLTLVADAGVAAGLAQRLPGAVRATLIKNGALALRCPDHAWVVPVVHALAAPVVLAPLPGFPQEAGAIRARDRFDLIVDGGPAAFLKPAAVVRAEGRGLRVLRDGAIARQDLEEASRCRLLFVCTGNTCRSPLAQGLCSRLLADTLGCEPAELAARGFRVQSAGLAAMMGSAATPEAVAIAAEHGADLAGHHSQPLSFELIAQADRLFAMTLGHLSMLHSLRLTVGPVPQLLSAAGADIDDPIGGSEEVYRLCAAQIREALRQRLPELQEA
jgi:L-threonylcarbamoyladenylate synthase